MKKSFALFFCILFILFSVTACSNTLKSSDIQVGDNVEYSKDYGVKDKKTAYEFLFYDYSFAKMNYTVQNLQKDKFYEISAYVCSSELNCNNTDDGVKIKYNNDSDITSSFVFSNYINSSTDNGDELVWKKISKVVYCYDGNIDFSILLGSEEAKLKGDISVDEVSVKPVEELDDYCIFSSDDKCINAVFLKSDVENSKVKDANIVSYLNFISKCRKSLNDLIGDDYTYGKTNFVLTSQKADFGNAGYPIFIDESKALSVLNNISKFNDSKVCNIETFALIHEMSHTFDRICGENDDKIWQFDSEFWANLKTFIVLDCLNIRQGDDVKERFNTEYAKKNNVYSSDDFAKNFYEISKKDNFKTLKKVFRKYDSIDTSNLNSDYDKFKRFEEIYNEVSNEKLKDEFSKDKWKTIENHFESNN